MFVKILKAIILLVFNKTYRKEVSFKYIHGDGLEIGALHYPLEVPKNANVKYVDINTKDENISIYPEVDAAKIVNTDYVEDGFTLYGIDSNSQDFLIANHVLEHSPNPISTILNWSRILKHNGILYLTVPNFEKCFDKGRSLTSVEHFIDDYSANIHDDKLLKEMNRDHYDEWVNISVPNIMKINKKVLVPEEMDKETAIDNMVNSMAEIHFHTFSYRTLKSLCLEYCENIDNSLHLIDVFRTTNDFEFIAILEKRVI